MPNNKVGSVQNPEAGSVHTSNVGAAADVPESPKGGAEGATPTVTASPEESLDRLRHQTGGGKQAALLDTYNAERNGNNSPLESGSGTSASNSGEPEKEPNAGGRLRFTSSGYTGTSSPKRSNLKRTRSDSSAKSSSTNPSAVGDHQNEHAEDKGHGNADVQGIEHMEASAAPNTDAEELSKKRFSSSTDHDEEFESLFGEPMDTPSGQHAGHTTNHEGSTQSPRDTAAGQIVHAPGGRDTKAGESNPGQSASPADYDEEFESLFGELMNTLPSQEGGHATNQETSGHAAHDAATAHSAHAPSARHTDAPAVHRTPSTSPEDDDEELDSLLTERTGSPSGISAGNASAQETNQRTTHHAPPTQAKPASEGIPLQRRDAATSSNSSSRGKAADAGAASKTEPGRFGSILASGKRAAAHFRDALSSLRSGNNQAQGTNNTAATADTSPQHQTNHGVIATTGGEGAGDVAIHRMGGNGSNRETGNHRLHGDSSAHARMSGANDAPAEHGAPAGSDTPPGDGTPARNSAPARHGATAGNGAPGGNDEPNGNGTPAENGTPGAGGDREPSQMDDLMKQQKDMLAQQAALSMMNQQATLANAVIQQQEAFVNMAINTALTGTEELSKTVDRGNRIATGAL